MHGGSLHGRLIGAVLLMCKRCGHTHGPLSAPPSKQRQLPREGKHADAGIYSNHWKAT